VKSCILSIKLMPFALLLAAASPAISHAEDVQASAAVDQAPGNAKNAVPVEIRPFRKALERRCEIGYGGAVPLLAPMKGALRLSVEQGAQVKKDDVIGTFSTDALEPKLAEAKRSVAYVKARLDYRAGVYLENLSAIHTLDEAGKSAARDHLAAQVADMKRLYGKGRLALGRFQDAQRRLDAADAALEQARRRHQMEMREANLNVISLQNDLARQEAELGRLQQEKHEATFLAPTAGRLIDIETAGVPGRSLNVEEGERLALVVDPGMMGARLTFDRREMQLVRNADIQVTLEDSGEQYDARILSVQAVESEAERRLGHFKNEIEIGFAAREGAVPVGADATCRFTRPEAETAPAVPVAAIRMGNGGNYVEKVKEGGSERVKVELGEVSENYARVLSGLKPGDRVLE